MHRREMLAGVAGISAVSIAGCAGGGGNSDDGELTLSTAGEETGSHAAGVGIAETVNEHSDSLTLNARTSPGTSANIRLIDEGEVDLGIGSSIDMMHANQGEEPFADPPVETTLCQTFPIFLTDAFMLKRDTEEFADVETIHDIPEGATVTWGEEANPSFGVTSYTLEMAGIPEDYFNIEYVQLGDFAAAYQEGRADFFAGLTMNQSTVPGYTQELDQVGEIDVVLWDDDVTQDALDQAELPFVATTVSADLFQNNLSVDEFTASSWVYTIQVPEDIDSNATYEMIDIVMEHSEEVQVFHDVLSEVGNPEYVENNTMTVDSIPIDSGTEEWHRDNGSWNDDWPSLDG